jgi:hypothetical protein
VAAPAGPAPTMMTSAVSAGLPVTDRAAAAGPVLGPVPAGMAV